MFASVRTHPSSRYLVKRGTQQSRIFVSDYSEFVSEVLENFSERY